MAHGFALAGGLATMRKIKRRVMLVTSCLLACVVGVLACGTAYAQTNTVKRPTKNGHLVQTFTNLLATADRIVVRDGGYTPSPEDKVLFTVTDKEEMGTVINNIRFKENASIDKCFCGGWPGIDWYKGDGRLLTSLQHSRAIRWGGFGYAYGDLPLTEESRVWIVEWLVSHGLNQSDIEKGMPKPEEKAKETP